MVVGLGILLNAESNVVKSQGQRVKFKAATAAATLPSPRNTVMRVVLKRPDTWE